MREISSFKTQICVLGKQRILNERNKDGKKKVRRLNYFTILPDDLCLLLFYRVSSSSLFSLLIKMFISYVPRALACNHSRRHCRCCSCCRMVKIVFLLHNFIGNKRVYKEKLIKY